MSLSAVEYLRHILDETEYLMDRAQGLTQEQFMRDGTLKRAFVRSIEIIGEASKRIPADFKHKYSHLEWRAMAGMRDRLIHGYFGVDYEIVWDVVTNKIPALHRAIRDILDAERSGRSEEKSPPDARCWIRQSVRSLRSLQHYGSAAATCLPWLGLGGYAEVQG